MTKITVDRNSITGKYMQVAVKQRNTIETSRLFDITRIEYIHDKGGITKDKHLIPGSIFDHHLMFYSGKRVVFKVWLSNNKKDKIFGSVSEAMESVGMSIPELEDSIMDIENDTIETTKDDVR